MLIGAVGKIIPSQDDGHLHYSNTCQYFFHLLVKLHEFTPALRDFVFTCFLEVAGAGSRGYFVALMAIGHLVR